MKITGRFALLTLLLAVLVSVFAGDTAAFADDDEVTKHPIDIELEKRIDADPSTAGMVEASYWAEEEWDKLLNKNYQALMKKLDKENQEFLRASQREWVKYRDLEFKFSGNFYGGFDGTMYRVIAAGFRADFVRNRALQLGSYLEEE
jgi:uncharacterized protein YecT (DUF1311 family)